MTAIDMRAYIDGERGQSGPADNEGGEMSHYISAERAKLEADHALALRMNYFHDLWAIK